MIRIGGIDIPEAKRIEISLTYIYGIGLTRSREILAAAKISPDIRVKNLTGEEIARIQKIIDKNYKVEGDLRREVRDNVRRLKDIKSYRGLRHDKNLPVRGQRTRHNARTRKGKRKTIGGMKVKLTKT